MSSSTPRVELPPLQVLATIESAEGNRAEARRLLLRSVAILEQLGPLQGQAASLALLAIIERDQGNMAEAQQLCEKSIDLADRSGDIEGRASNPYHSRATGGIGG